MMTDEYVFSLEKRIEVLESLIKTKRQKRGMGVDKLIKKIRNSGPEGISPSIILRQKDAALFKKIISETNEVSLVLTHRATAGRPVCRYIHSDYLK